MPVYVNRSATVDQLLLGRRDGVQISQSRDVDALMEYFDRIESALDMFLGVESCDGTLPADALRHAAELGLVKSDSTRSSGAS